MKLGPFLLGPNDTKENGIYCRDARKAIKGIPDNSIDLVFTSPPYNVGIKYETYDDKLDELEFWSLQETWLRDAFRVTVDRGRLYAIVSDVMLWRFRPLAESIGWRFHQILVWCKPNLVGGGRITKDWNTTSEWCLLFHKGKRSPMQSGPFGVVTHNWLVAASAQSNFTGHKKKQHPAQMSIDVAYGWLSRSPGLVVMDPFIGSGTTAMACKMLGKKWIGFDVGVETCEIARERLCNTQPPLFEIQSEQAVLDF